MGGLHEGVRLGACVSVSPKPEAGANGAAGGTGGEATESGKYCLLSMHAIASPD